MKFFLPDNLDVIDPSFDFETETRNFYRVRHQEEIYAHEFFARAPYDGILVSKASVDASGDKKTRYTLAQRHRLLREGVNRFFRLEQGQQTLASMGDCGAYSYVREELPPFSVEEVIEFYECCGFDYGLSVDHVILEFLQNRDRCVPDVWRRRQEITIELAATFKRAHHVGRYHWEPIGVAQGWDAASYVTAVEALQSMGYHRIALGGLAPLRTDLILECLEELNGIRRLETQFHLLGIMRTKFFAAFKRYGVTSFDGTSPLREAFKDEKDNYYMPQRAYIAIRVPQAGTSLKLLKKIRTGEIDARLASNLEQTCLTRLDAYDRREASLDSVLEVLQAYERLHAGQLDRIADYREVLQERPWNDCPCSVCKTLGIRVLLFRTAEHNKRRAFHNLDVFYGRLQREFEESTL